MQNDRPIEDPRLQEALNLIQMICREYDLAGAIMLVSEHEAAFAYPLCTTWNAVVEDDSLPLGFRFRLKTAEQGPERAEQLALGTGHMLHQLKDFGAQTQLWMGDLLRNLAKAGMRFTHVPFNGRKLPRLTSAPPALTKESPMPTDWIKQINDALYALGAYPDLEACVVQGNEALLVLEDAQGYAVYQAPAAVVALLTTLTPPPQASDIDMCALAVNDLRTHVLPEDQAARVTWHAHAGYCWS